MNTTTQPSTPDELAREIETLKRTLEAYRVRARKLYAPEFADSEAAKREERMRDVDGRLEAALGVLRYFGFEMADQISEGVKMLTTEEKPDGTKDCAFVRVIPGGLHATDQSELKLLRQTHDEVHHPETGLIARFTALQSRAEKAERENSDLRSALCCIKDRVVADEDFSADEIREYVENRAGKYSQGIDWTREAVVRELESDLAAARREVEAERNLHGQTRVVVEELNIIANDLRNAGQPQFIRSEAIRLLREEVASLRAQLTALQSRADGLAKLVGIDTPWPAETLYKALVVAERQLKSGGRDFDGWESIQAAAMVAETRLHAYRNPQPTDKGEGR